MTTPLRLRYQTIEFGEIDIHVCALRDKQEFSDPYGTAFNLGINSSLWPLFGVIWPSSMVLAYHVHELQTDNKKILEIGCGMALSSLLLNKKNADITATDYHPEVEFFLQRNTKLNGDSNIAFEQVNWSDTSDNLGRFDLIIGSDILYEDEHIDLIADFIEKHAERQCEIIIVDPGRGRKTKLSLELENFGFNFTHNKPENTDYLEQEFKGYILEFQRNK